MFCCSYICNDFIDMFLMYQNEANQTILKLPGSEPFPNGLLDTNYEFQSFVTGGLGVYSEDSQ